MKRIFIHIPKNGGMTVRKGLYRTEKGFAYGIRLSTRDHLCSKEYAGRLDAVMSALGQSKGYEHARWRDFREDLRNEAVAFSIVRNPWARTASRYTFAVKVGDPSGKKPFAEFLEERHDHAGKEFFWHRAVHGWYPQKDYVVDESGNLRCDILRTECLTQDLEAYFGVRYETKHNVSDTGRKMIGLKDWRDLYGPEEYDIVAEWYKDDIEFFGFDFDSSATRNLWCGLS